MMIRRYGFLVLLFELVVACFLAGCSSDVSSAQESQPAVQAEKPAAISLTSSITSTEKTRATSDEQTTQINTSVKVGVYGVGTCGFVTNGENSAYSVESNGNLTSKHVMGWPADESSVSIYAYAPYNEAWAYNSANTFSVANDQTSVEGYLASDLLYGIPDKNPVEPTNTAVALKFTHQLSKVNITLEKTDESIDLTKARVIINNTKLTTSLNPATGALGEASGDAANILAVSALGKATKAYVIIVPQTLKAGTMLATIDTNPSGDDNKTYVARLGSDTKFESGKSYDFTMTLSVAPEVTLTQSSTSINAWTDDMNVATNMKESATIGDYILKDGSVLRQDDSEFDTKKADAIAVIFSTTVSATDAAAGYDGYAMGLVRAKNKTWYAGEAYGLTVTGLEEALADLDGRDKTNTVLNSAKYGEIADSLAIAANKTNNHLAYMGDYSLKKTTAATNLSDWFCPSYGQLALILNNLGGAGITSSSITSVNDKGDVAFSNYSAFYKYDADTSVGKVGNSTIVNAVNAYVTKVGKGDILAMGNITIATITENARRNNGETFFIYSIQAGNSDPKKESWEMSAAQGKWSNSSNAAVGGFSILPVLAFRMK